MTNHEKEFKKTSDIILEIKCDLPNKITLKEFFNRIRESGRYLVILILIAPFLLPVSIPGSSTPFGLLIMILEFSNLFNREPYLPKVIGNYVLSYENVNKLFDVLERALNKLEKLTRPRLFIIGSNEKLAKFTSILIIILAFLLLLPIPVPFTDFVPALAILLLTFGKLEHDGLCILLGYLVTIVAISYFSLIIYFGFGIVQFFISSKFF